jgi:hypothetical protein
LLPPSVILQSVECESNFAFRCCLGPLGEGMQETESATADRDVQDALLQAAPAAKLPKVGSGHRPDMRHGQGGCELLQKLELCDQSCRLSRGEIFEELPDRRATRRRFVEDEFPVRQVASDYSEVVIFWQVWQACELVPVDYR